MAGRALQARNARIKARDGFTCQLCGRLTVELEIDHERPLSDGGTDDDGNVRALCVTCHAAKSKAESLAGRLRNL